MKTLTLQFILWGGELTNETFNLPDNGILCETSFVNIGGKGTTGYIYAVERTPENEDIINNCTCCRKDKVLTPSQIFLFFDGSKFIDGDVEIVSVDRLNEFADFNYWVAVSNFKYVTIDTLKKLYGDKKEDWINFRFKYVKPLRFTGCGFSIDAFEVYHHNVVETEKTIDTIEKSILNLYPLGENASKINNDKATWYNFDLFNPVVQKRMQEILGMINLK
jgi:hypothetical protein